MSKREDIKDGTQAATLESRAGLIYTCNCGWIDLGHLNPENARMEIGAANLWKQMLSEGPAAVDFPCGPAPSHGPAATVAHYLVMPGRCDQDPYYKFSDGSTGFKVHYRQDHAGYPTKPGREGRYIVRHGLTTEQKKSVALAIFMEVSHRFEDLQSYFGLITDSGYSQEDLVSNLIGFYIGIGELSRQDALSACHPVSDETAYAIWDGEGAVGSNKNPRWDPSFAKRTDHESETACIDECATQPKAFPAIFQRIKPAIKGLWHVEIPAGYQ